MVPSTIYKEMIAHCRSYLPFEGCGLLSGVGNRVCHLWPLHNEAQSDKRFFVSKKYVEATIKETQKKDESILAIYHSHPTTTAKPSSYDLLQHTDPNVHMVIISFKKQTPDVKCYHMMNQRPVSIPVYVLSD